MGAKVHSRYADHLLGFLFFLEAIFFIPVDPILIFFCLERPERALRYAAISTIFSTLGGLTGYLIGLILWEWVGPQVVHSKIVTSIVSPEMFDYLCKQYDLYAHWAILIAGFTPVPYKAATLSAGFCKISLVPFIICSIISRGARFYLLAIVIKIWGKQIRRYIDRYFNLLVLLTVILIVGTIWLIKR